MGVNNQEELGLVLFFHVRRGFGRVKTESHPGGVFVHFSEVKERAQILIPNELVWVSVNRGPKGLFCSRVRRISSRHIGVIHRSQPGVAWIKGEDHHLYRFDPTDILSDNAYSRVEPGWRVQFSPIEEGENLEAKEIVVCDTRSPLAQLVKLDQWADRLYGLARLARPEPWDEAASHKAHGVLENYLFESFRILHHESGIEYLPDAAHPSVAIWNTGLLTPHGEEIIARMDALPASPRHKGYLAPASWRLSGFFPSSDRRLPSHSRNLPLATDFIPFQKLVPDPRLPIVPDLDHLMERYWRFPQDWSALSAQEKIQRLQGALHQAGQLLRRQARLAIPQWYEEKVQYLVPLQTGLDEEPVAAFVLEEDHDCLRVQTILPLAWAYQNARLLGPQEGNWLASWRKKAHTSPEAYSVQS